MIRRTNVQGGQQVDFVIEGQSPVSVVGDFNDWDPRRGAMASDDGGVQTWSTVLQPGRYPFRYLRDGEFFDEPDADEVEPNGYGQSHGVLVVSEASPAQADHRLSILSEIDAGRSVQVHGAPDYLDQLRRSLLDGGCSMYLSEVAGELVLVVDPGPGESGTDVVDIGDAPST